MMACFFIPAAWEIGLKWHANYVRQSIRIKDMIHIMMMVKTYNEQHHHLRLEDSFFFPEGADTTSGNGTKHKSLECKIVYFNLHVYPLVPFMY